MVLGFAFQGIGKGKKSAPHRYGVEVDRACPQCGAAGVPLLFGLPAPEAREAAANGQLALGGCLVGDDPPNWQCPQHHRWRDPDEKMWEARLLAILATYGYSESDEPAERSP